ncbi:PGRS repeat-containing protein, partial [Mycolicibacter algericus]|uniref:PGRS repeat-containing protein n=1 Tax=Mycolicibacter algericus TaxID=1288388 RepID=UPI003C756A9C
MAGAASSVGAFLAFGMAPLAAAPAAHADVDFDLGDLFGDLLSSWSSTDVGDATSTWDLGALFGAADPGSAADMFSWTGIMDQWFYEPMHNLTQLWITSPFGESINGMINDWSGLYLIGNGVDGTEASPDGGDGGLWFGDGGAGWDSDEAGVAGGNGGDALGWLGNGGDGGAGGAGAAGGDGGASGWFMGNGGDGGAGGAATAAGGSGGAGGDGGASAAWFFGNGGAGGIGGAGADGVAGSFAMDGTATAATGGGIGGAGGEGGRSGYLFGDGGKGGAG